MICSLFVCRFFHLVQNGEPFSAASVMDYMQPGGYSIRIWNELKQEVISMLTLFFMIFLLLGIVRIGLRFAWGTTKFLFGLGLFWFCPLLFVLAVLFGAFHHLWIPILIVAILCGKSFRSI